MTTTPPRIRRALCAALFAAALPLTSASLRAQTTWTAYNHTLDITPGGAFDFSPLLDAPAGKYGRVVPTADGHFKFLNRAGNVRFAGVNLNYSAQFLDDASIATLVDTLARSGYNAVRLHHFDGEITTTGGLGGSLNTTQLNKIRRLFRSLKDRGIYISIDLYCSRPIPSGSFGITGAISPNDYKALIPVSTDALNDWKAFASALLNYSGDGFPAWKNDPALIGICPVNEDNLYQHWDGNSNVKALYDPLIAAFPPLSGETADQKRNRFLFTKHKESDGVLIGYLKNTLGVTTPITGTNFGGAVQGLVYQRTGYDYTDTHVYYNHPYPSWPPLTTHDRSLSADGAAMPRDHMPVRYFGKPFTVTEWNACRPNKHRAEASVIMPAYSSLQDWDALFCFQYGDKDNRILTGHHYGSFGVYSDPIGLITARTTSLIFQRKDFLPSTRTIVWGVRESQAYKSDSSGNPGSFISSYFYNVGLVSKIGMMPQPDAEAMRLLPSTDPKHAHGVVTDNVSVPSGWYGSTSSIVSTLQTAGKIPSGSYSNNIYKSDTSEIVLNRTDAITTAISPRSELFALAPYGGDDGGGNSDLGRPLTGIVKRIVNADAPASVSVISLDHDRALSAANRLLITHLSDALPQGATFSSSARTTLTSWGASEAYPNSSQTPLAHLVAPAQTDVSLELPGTTWRAWALDATGKRVANVTLASGSGNLKNIVLNTSIGGTGAGNTRLAYEIARTDYLTWGFPTSVRANLGTAGWSARSAYNTNTATDHTGTSQFTDTNVPRLFLLNGTGANGGSGAVFAHGGNNSTAANRHNRFTIATTFEPFSTIVPTGTVKAYWEYAFNNTGTNTRLRLLVRANGQWFASNTEFTAATASSASSMTAIENRSLDLNGSNGLQTTQWNSASIGEGGAISLNGQVTTAPGQAIDGLGFYITTNGATGQVAFVDHVRLAIEP